MKISVLPANATNADLIILALVGVYLCTCIYCMGSLISVKPNH